MKRISALTILLAALAFPAAAQEYADGIYRGFYYDGGIEQIAIQFELKDGRFDSLVYRGVKYKDGDYMSEDASDAQKAILRQYRQLADQCGKTDTHKNYQHDDRTPPHLARGGFGGHFCFCFFRHDCTNPFLQRPENPKVRRNRHRPGFRPFPA